MLKRSDGWSCNSHDVLVLGSTNYVVNKRYKYYGIFLCFLSIASFAIEIANVVYTVINSNSSESLNLPYILTWIAAGTWGSIPVRIPIFYGACIRLHMHTICYIKL